MRSLAEEIDTNVFNGCLHSVEAECLAFDVHLVDQVVDLALVTLKPWVDVGLVDVDRALLARHDEVQVDCEAHPGVERYPVEDEVELRLNQQEDRQGGPVHEPWCKVGGIAGADSFVGGEDGEEDGGDGAGGRVSRAYTFGSLYKTPSLTYVRMSAMKPNMVSCSARG